MPPNQRVTPLMARRTSAVLVVALAMTASAVNTRALAVTRRTTKPKATSTQTTVKAPSWRVLSVSSKGLSEVSGCAFSRRVPNRVWLHNDSGDGPMIVPVDVTSGVVGRPVTLNGVDVVDPEDIAVTTSGDVILADIGDNAVVRSSVQLYRFPEPAANASSTDATRIDLTYPDGPHNAEAFAVSSDGAVGLIFTKEASGIASAYRVDLTTTSPQQLTRIGQVTVTGESGTKANMLSAADAVGNSVVLRSFQHGYALDVPSGGSMSDVVNAKPRRFAVPSMAQGEALCASPDGRTLVTASESQGESTFALAVGATPR
jgi:hypothetical protein